MPYMPGIKVTTTNVTKDKPMLLPLLAFLDTRLFLARLMLFQRFNDCARKHDLAPPCFRLWFSFNIPHAIHPGQSTPNPQYILSQIHIAPMKRDQFTAPHTSGNSYQEERI